MWGIQPILFLKVQGGKSTVYKRRGIVRNQIRVDKDQIDIKEAISKGGTKHMGVIYPKEERRMISVINGSM